MCQFDDDIGDLPPFLLLLLRARSGDIHPRGGGDDGTSIPHPPPFPPSFFARPIRRAKEEEEEEKEGTSYVTLLSYEPSCWLQHFPSSKDLFLFMVMHLKYHTIFAFRLPSDVVSPFFHAASFLRPYMPYLARFSTFLSPSPPPPMSYGRRIWQLAEGGKMVGGRMRRMGDKEEKRRRRQQQRSQPPKNPTYVYTAEEEGRGAAGSHNY